MAPPVTCWPANAGANVESDQAYRYGSLEARAIVQATYVSVQAQPTVEAVYVCLSEHLERIKFGLDDAQAHFAVLSVSRHQVSLERSDFASSTLQRIFSEPVVLTASPARYLPFDHDSPAATIKPAVKAALVGMLSRRVPHVSLTALAEAAMPHYVLFARRAQGVLVRKVADAALELATEEPGTFEFRPRTGNRDGMVRLLRTPEDHDPRGRTQAYQALARQRRRGPVSRYVDPDQLDLLEELDRTGPESDTVGTDAGDE